MLCKLVVKELEETQETESGSSASGDMRVQAIGLSSNQILAPVIINIPWNFFCVTTSYASVLRPTQFESFVLELLPLPRAERGTLDQASSHEETTRGKNAKPLSVAGKRTRVCFASLPPVKLWFGTY